MCITHCVIIQGFAKASIWDEVLSGWGAGRRKRRKKHFLYILKQVVPPPPPPPPILDFFSKTSVALTPLCLSQSKTFVPSLQLRDLIISPHTLIKSLSCHFVSTDKDFISIFLHSKSSLTDLIISHFHSHKVLSATRGHQVLECKGKNLLFS